MVIRHPYIRTQEQPLSGILISPGQLQNAMTKEPWLVFDVRHDLADHDAGRRAYDEGHIPGALYLDHEHQLSAPRTGANGRHPLPDPADFLSLLRGLDLRPESRVVAYDASGGMFAAHLWWMLRWVGHEHVAVLDGGWQAWLSAGGLVEAGVAHGGMQAAKPGFERASPAVHAAASRHSGAESGAGRQDAGREVLQQGMPTVDAQKVLTNLQDPVFTVVDARAPERFRGEVEPMDPVAGHIDRKSTRLNSSHVKTSYA